MAKEHGGEVVLSQRVAEELARTWLAVDGAPVVEWYGYESNFEDYRNLVGQRVKLVLVPEADSGGDRG